MYIDFHAHVLPEVDHGSSGLEMSMRQLARAKEVNVSKVVATPHFYPHAQRLSRFLEKRERAAERLRGEAHKLGIELYVGAEVFLSEGVQHLPDLERLCVEGTNVILLEMPDTSWNEKLFEMIYEIERDRGLRPLMAHIDRYPPKEVEQLLNLDVMAQLNVTPLCSLFQRRSNLRWIREDRVFALGSDVHGDGAEYRDFAKAMKILRDEAAVIMERSEELLLARDIRNTD